MGGNASYNSLQLSAEQRMRYGLTMLANYTWSKAIDNSPYNQSSTAIASGNSYVLPIYEPNFKRLDHGPSDFDHRNVTSISFVYILPKVMQDAPGALRYVINGWQTSGLFQTRSGDPLTVSASSNNSSGSGQSRDRAVFLGGNAYGGSACPATAHCKNWLNAASFSANAAGTYGNIVKGSFVGTPLYGRRPGHRTRLPLHREGRAAVPGGVLQPLQPHQLWRSECDPHAGWHLWRDHRHHTTKWRCREISSHRTVLTQTELLDSAGFVYREALKNKVADIYARDTRYLWP